MPTHFSSHEAESLVIALIDALEFRRAGIARLLEEWAEASGISIASLDSPSSLAEIRPPRQCRMAILSIGAAYVGDSNISHALEQIRTAVPDASLVILSDTKEPRQVVSAFKAGAQGFIATGTDPNVALRALSFILCGGTFFPPHALAGLPQLSDTPTGVQAHASPGPHGALIASGNLTVRQKEVLACLRLGKSNKLIARELHMQEATVKVHIRQIMRKLGAANRTQAALRAAEMSEAADTIEGSPATLPEPPPQGSPLSPRSVSPGPSAPGVLSPNPSR
ncbi:response regulator transcription factor [Microvirga roseola]|uniref:response regulator transcription factor n=1 Tax=Microvirga roseola TaxID=2883126 RepID=UPI001E4DEF99|nr:response regulator transcription factor [Microvirga roseola]